LLGHLFVRELQSCLDQEGCARNYERVWWHPPVSPRAVFEPVSPNEARVLQMIADGNSNKDIAGKLNVTEEAVKGQVRKYSGKLGAKDRTHAVFGMKRGIIS